MLEIYGRKNSNQVIQLMWTVGELGLDYTRHNVGGSFGGLDTPDDKALNPNQLILTIKNDGFNLWESYAIIRYLCKTYGSGFLSPTDNKQAAIADQWMEWANSRFMPVLFPIFWALIRTPVTQQDPEHIKSMAEQTGELLRLVEHQLSGKEYITGSSLTMGDIPLGSLMFKYYTLDIVRPSLPNVEAWYGRLQQRIAYREHAMNTFGSSTEEWLALEKANA